MTNSKAYRVAVIRGEDAAPEAMDAAIDVINLLAPGIEWTYPVVGLAAKERGESPFPDAAKIEIDRSDATLFGATSGPSALALFYLRWGRQTFANVRPTKWMRGCQTPLASPEGLDIVIVRENLEDSYLFLEGDLVDLKPLGLKSPTLGMAPENMGRGTYALKAITQDGSERIARFAFELAKKRKVQGKPGKVTASAKYNMLPKTDGLFVEVAKEVAKSYPEIDFETLIIDDFAHRLVRRAQDFDVVLLPNLYGDILSDAVAGLSGGLGLAPSGCYGEHFAYFESAHGTAPDLTGKGLINPTATLLSGAMMLDYLGIEGAGERLRAAIAAVYERGERLTPDQGGNSGTKEFCNAIIAELD